MRSRFLALSPLVLLAACGGGGGGTLSAGAVAPPTGSPAPSPTPSPTSTPVPNPTPTPTPPSSPAPTNLFDVTAATEFQAVGAAHSLFRRASDNATLYRGNASTVEAPSGKITYDPRDGVFTISIADEKAGVTRDVRFQDPSHRSTQDTARRGEFQVPLLSGFNYLQALDGDASLTFFYKRPGSGNSFVSLGGFERSSVDRNTGDSSSEQGVFAFGTPSGSLRVPTTGSGRFEGELLATMIGQVGGSTPVLQWIAGTSGVDVDFAARSLKVTMTGTVGPAFVKTEAVSDATLRIKSGYTFSAEATAAWTAASTAFAGRFSTAGFTGGGERIPLDFTSVAAGGAVAGASSIDGTFYGPDAQNIGGNFRIVGGVPDQRVDILGAFVGAKK